MSRAPVCVTGVAAVTALGGTLEATYAAVRAGHRGRRVLAQGATLGVAIAGYPAAEPGAAAHAIDDGRARYMSAGMRYLEAATHEALLAAGLSEDVALGDFGIAVAAATGERETVAEIEAVCAATDVATGRANPDRYAAALLSRPPRSALRTQPGLLSGMLAVLHRVHGPCLTVNGETEAGWIALREVCEAIQAGWCERWIVGGTFHFDDPWLLLTHAGWGQTLGSGAGVLILESVAAVSRRGARTLATLAFDAASDDAPTDGARRRAGRGGASGRMGDPSGPRLPVAIAGGVLRGVALRALIGDTLPAEVPVAAALAVRGLAERATGASLGARDAPDPHVGGVELHLEGEPDRLTLVGATEGEALRAGG